MTRLDHACLFPQHPGDQQAMLAAIGVEFARRIVCADSGRTALEARAGNSAGADRNRTHRACRRNWRREMSPRAESLFSGRRQLRPFRSGRRRLRGLARRILHFVHAVSARSQSGKPASVLRISNADQPTDRHGCFQRQPVRRRQRRDRSRADVHARHRARKAAWSRRPACIPNIGRFWKPIWRIWAPNW